MMDESQPSTELHESPCYHSYSGVSAASMCLPKRHSHIFSMSLACLRGILQGSPDGSLFTYDSHFRKPVFPHGKIWTLPCHLKSCRVGTIPHPLLLGGIPTPLKNMSQLGLLFPTEWTNTKNCSKPPARYGYHVFLNKPVYII